MQKQDKAKPKEQITLTFISMKLAELREQLEKDILGLFNESELEDYGVSETKRLLSSKITEN